MSGRKWNRIGLYPFNRIVYEIKNGIGYIKECSYNGNLRFEGYYLNGQKNGKGKEYYDYGGLGFEVEYLYDYKLKGIEYYKCGKLRFEGDYLFNKKYNGKG